MRVLALALLLCGIAALPAAATTAPTSVRGMVIRSLDGNGNNTSHGTWGQANTQYVRVAAPNYADGIAAMVAGPAARYASNRIFNDVGQNLFSENGVSQM